MLANAPAMGGAAAANARPGVGGFVKQAGQWLRDPNNAFLATQAAGTALQGYGSYQQNRYLQEQEEEARRRRRAQAEFLLPFLEQMGGQLSERLDRRM
jgi:hypothetical protein